MLLVGEAGVVIPGVTGPLIKLQAPVPTLGVLAAMVAVPEETQAESGLPALEVVGGCVMVMLTLAPDAVQGLLLIVQRTTTGPTPPVCVKVEEPLAGLLKVPVPPLTMLHAPVPTLGVLPPNAALVPLAHIICALPTVEVVGGWLMLMLTLAVEAGQGALPVIVQRTTTGPAPPVWVKVAFGLLALLKFPVPPLTTLHAPVPTLGVLPPRPALIPLAHIVCAPPTVAVVGGCTTVMIILSEVAVQTPLLIVQRSTTGPAPPVWVNVEVGDAALLKVPVPPLTTDQAPVPNAGVLAPNAALVLFAQTDISAPAKAMEGTVQKLRRPNRKLPMSTAASSHIDNTQLPFGSPVNPLRVCSGA